MKFSKDVWQSGNRERITGLIGLGLLVAALPTLALAQEKAKEPAEKAPAVQVVRDAVAAGISDREPVDSGQAFAPTAERLYYFTEVQTEAPTAEVIHVWYHSDQEVARVPLAVQGPRWRTWSSKQILPEWTGPWKVEAVTSDGAVLASKTFTVATPPPAPETPPPAKPEGTKPEGKSSGPY